MVSSHIIETAALDTCPVAGRGTTSKDAQMMEIKSERMVLVGVYASKQFPIGSSLHGDKWNQAFSWAHA
jgi:hypothetical protein